MIAFFFTYLSYNHDIVSIESYGNALFLFFREHLV